MKTYTLGQVIDKMKYGEIAFVYKGHYELDKNEFGLEFSEEYFFYEEKHMGALTFSNGNYVIVSYDGNDYDETRYVIMDRELYFKLKG